MSRLNYILSRHQTQSRTFPYMINSWYTCLPLFGLARRRRFSGSKLFANFESRREREREKERERERERERDAYESLVISKNIMYRC